MALLLGTAGCGGGRNSIVGFGNGGNTFNQEWLAEELAEALAEHQGTPKVTDEMLGEIFGSILERAKTGDSEAALIVLKVAEEQRQAEEG
jgi:hypothetical protein